MVESFKTGRQEGCRPLLKNLFTIFPLPAGKGIEGMGHLDGCCPCVFLAAVGLRESHLGEERFHHSLVLQLL